MQLLRPRVAHYAWGTTTDIPALLGVAPTGEPFAELWVGAHPVLPSWLDPGPGTLHDLAPSLPFLMKVLAIGSPLSIQLHPTDEQAADGFARENALGIPLDDPNRSYRDGAGKPEIVCALTRFEALAGLRPCEESAADFELLGLKVWAQAIRTQPVRQTIGEMLTLPVAEQSMLVDVVATASESLPTWLRSMAKLHPADAGVLVALLMNHQVLEPGEALVTPPGLLHGYLSGTAVEVMGSSDNVLRCGLTAKRVDVPGVLEVMDVAAPTERRAAAATHRVAAGFGLTLGPTSVSGPALVLALGGDVRVDLGSSAGSSQSSAGGAPVGQGRAAYIAPGETAAVSGRAATAFGITA